MVLLLASEVQQLLHNKFVIILGDSVQRAVYKDLVLLLQKDCLLTNKQLRARGELSFEKDQLVKGGELDTLHNRTNYREVREFCSDHHLVRFYFLTRVYSDYLENILEELQSGEHAPDVIIMNSCLWDISRYGRNSCSSYRQNLESLFGRMDQVLPKSCLLVWNTAMPLGDSIKATFLPGKGRHRYQVSIAALKRKVMEANFYSCVEAKKHCFDVLDLHFHFRHARMHLQGDGVHWNEHAHRRLSHLLLAHVADAWGVELPHREPEPGSAAWERPGQVKEWQERRPQAHRGWQPCPSSPLLPLPRPRPLLPSPGLPIRPLPLLPCPGPLHQVGPPLPPCPQDSYFSSDPIFHSEEFYIHSDGSPPTHAGHAFEGDFGFSPQPPMPSFHPPCYQRRGPIVHRGLPRYHVRGPYVPWRERPRRPRRRNPESRPQ
ncbi:PC-esterase domain-containing protein 1B [Nannospalax galili]|uniref:PC-esterase domain-containing protein 1B n=1 Tax=Nannospalax galili TaxID=1026970 RepID=UPI0004ED3FFA|nr:PC-esterase domain-containing protein 1B [Nannospalax galili]XP_017655659.1 PC-esterase domain-containing protein 1B [Nannospalax galili]XP_017655660.1 PC-esterase domain-containing protein 1B [Nannospalax galili]